MSRRGGILWHWLCNTHEPPHVLLVPFLCCYAAHNTDRDAQGAHTRAAMLPTTQTGTHKGHTTRVCRFGKMKNPTTTAGQIRGGTDVTRRPSFPSSSPSLLQFLFLACVEASRVDYRRRLSRHDGLVAFVGQLHCGTKQGRVLQPTYCIMCRATVALFFFLSRRGEGRGLEDPFP